MLKKIIYTSIFIICAIVAVSSYTHPVGAVTNDTNLSGFAWSDGIGWISFNNLSDGSAQEYNVKLLSDGTLSGWAWADSVGWIKFDPAFTGVSGQGDNFGAKVNGTSVLGWARACSGTVNKDCASADRTDGWDGWFKLTNVSLIADATTRKKFQGYSWGSEVMGWINMFPNYPIQDGGSGGSGSDDTKCRGVCVGDPTVGATCTVSGASYSNSSANIALTPGQVATWKANPTGSTAYTYLWNDRDPSKIDANIDGKTTQEVTKRCSVAATYGPEVTVTDAKDALSSVDKVTASCPRVTCMTGSAPASLSTGMFAGLSIADANKRVSSLVSVEVGDTAAIRSEQSGTVKPDCVASGQYDNEKPADKTAAATNSTYTFVTNPLVSTGTYTYTLTCTNSTSHQVSVSSATVVVKPKSKVTEF